MRAGRNLERAHVAPTEVHAVVAEVGAAVEILSGDDPVARTHGQFRFVFGVTDRNHEFVDVGRVLDHHLLARRLVAADLDRRQRMLQSPSQLAGAVGVVLPTEHLVDDVHVGEQIGDDAMIGLVLDVVEEDRTSAVQVLLDRCDLEIRIHLGVGFDQVAFLLEPFEGASQVDDQLGCHAGHLQNRCAHVFSPFVASIVAFVGGGSGSVAAFVGGRKAIRDRVPESGVVGAAQSAPRVRGDLAIPGDGARRRLYFEPRVCANAAPAGSAARRRAGFDRRKASAAADDDPAGEPLREVSPCRI